MIRVMIADNHEFMREGIKHSLRGRTDIGVTYEAPDEECLLAVLRQDSACSDLLILDPHVTSTTEEQLVHQIREISAATPILIFATRDDDMLVVNLMRAGAQGYLNKRCSAAELLRAISRVVAGRVYVDDLVAERLALSVMKPTKPLAHNRLSHRELEVFSLLVNGNTVTKIARLLDLSVKTVSTHKTRIMRRMNFCSLSEMIQYAVVNDLITSFAPSHKCH